MSLILSFIALEAIMKSVCRNLQMTINLEVSCAMEPGRFRPQITPHLAVQTNELYRRPTRRPTATCLLTHGQCHIEGSASFRVLQVHRELLLTHSTTAFSQPRLSNDAALTEYLPWLKRWLKRPRLTPPAISLLQHWLLLPRRP